MNNLLSIDFGERYIGFAIRTVKTQIPIPIEVVDIKKDNIANKISTYVDSYDINEFIIGYPFCLLYTSPSPRDRSVSRMPSST